MIAVDPAAVIDFAVQATATLVGASAAFMLESFRQRRREQRDKIQEVKAALYALLSRRSFLRNLATQHLEPLRNDPHRAFMLVPITAAPSAIDMDLSKLTFLLDLRDKELLQHIEIADLRFRTVVSLIEQRNALHLEFQQRMEQAQLKSGEATFAGDQVRDLAGPLVTARLQSLTDLLFAATDDALESTLSTYRRAEVAFLAEFPKERLWHVEERELTP